MPDVIVIDTNVIRHVARGNQDAADALVRRIKQGDTIYISRAAYNELVDGAPTAQLRAHYRGIVSDMRIQIAPDGQMADRIDFLSKNLQHQPSKRGEPGQIQEYGNAPYHERPGDAFVAAQTKAIGAKLWTMDRPFTNRAANLGVLTVPECSIPVVNGVEDGNRARKLLGLNPRHIDVNGNPITVHTSAASARVPLANRSGATPMVGMADNSLPQELSPVSARGGAKIEGMQMLFQGVNFMLNFFGDRVQKAKVDAALKAIGRPVADAQRQNPKSGEAKFQLVEFSVIGGLDDVYEQSIKLPNARNADFVILQPPSEIYWYNVNGRQTVRVPLKMLPTANKNEIPVVDLDPYMPFHAAAAMCFPFDDWAETVFNIVRPTDNYRLLASYTNFGLIRWIRAENIHLTG